MASTFDNDLRLEEMATGENAGSWGTKTNTNLELIADAFGYGTFTIADADTTLTIPDGSGSDNALRSLYLKISSSADLTTTRVLTIDPNTVSKLWYIENNTSGGQTITISQGSGANINILNGQAKLVATDGAGAGAAVIDVTQDLAIPDLFIDDDLSLQSDGAIINFGEDADVTLTHVADTGLRLNAAMALEFRDGDLSINSSADGQLDIDADTTVQIATTTLDVDANTQIDGTVNVGVDDTGYDVKFFGATAGKYMLWDESADTLEVEGNLTVDTDTLYVDSTNDRVGINTDSPDATLELSNSSSIPSISFGRTPYSTHGSLTIGGTSTGHLTSNTDADGNSTVNVNASRISIENGDISFLRSPSTAAGSARTFTEYMKIDSAGRVKIGTTSNTPAGDGVAGFVFGDNTAGTPATGIASFAADGAAPLLLTRLTSDGNVLGIADGTTTRGLLRVVSSNLAIQGNNNLVFSTGGSNLERMRVDSAGSVSIGGFAPKTWSLGRGLHIGNAENALWGEGDYAFHMMQNVYYNSGWKYVHSDEANRFALEDGKFVWSTAPTGTADAALTFSERMRLTNTGNLGIGVSTPQTLLHVNQQTSTSDAIVRITNSNTPASGGGHRVEFGDGTGTTEGSTVFRYAYIAGERSGASNDGHFIVGTKPDNSTSPREHLRVSSSGELTITGTYNGNARDDAYVIFGIKNSNGDSKKAQIHAVKTADISSELIFSTTASHTFSERMRISDSGYLGINETDPTTKLHIKNSSVGESWSAYNGTLATLEDNSGNGAILQFVSNNSYTGEVWFGDAASRNQGRIRYEHDGDRLELWANAAVQQAITSDGVTQVNQLGMGTTGSDTPGFLRTKGTSSSTLNFDFIVDVDTGSWTPLTFYVFVGSINSSAERPRSAYFVIRAGVYNGSLGSVGVAASIGDTSDVSVALSDQGGLDPMTVRVAVSHPNNRVIATVLANGYMGIQRCD